MSFRFDRHVRIGVTGAAILSLLLAYAATIAPPVSADNYSASFCEARPALCTETIEPFNYEGQYVGHDEPSVLFYSSVPGSGNSNLYQLTLPKDPPTLPKQDGTGGTWNFQLHPAFWFGMAMCDDQSAPLPGATCAADSDTNIFNSTNPSSAKFMGKHPGTGFMEMQFYPPGWDSFGCTQTQWCAALNIDSFSSNSTTGKLNNNDCLAEAGEEYVNFAFITKDGKALGPADPLRQDASTFTLTPDTLFFSSGDHLTVDMHDTAAGFTVIIHDQTTGQSGSMTASVANQFGHPLYQPGASSCTDQPYAFHPMYATSSPETRVLWAAHSYNVAYSDEIGHFEYCTPNTPTTGRCSDPSGRDSDDRGCLTAPAGPDPNGAFSTISGCSASDEDFDGPEYQPNWPGTNPNATVDAQLHAQPVVFTSPLFTGPGSSGLWNYQQAAFEVNLPRIEGADSSPNNDCQRHAFNPMDPNPGAGCVNPPNGASFYPIYSTGVQDGHCVWMEGGAYIPSATNTFGGDSKAEYGPYVVSVYPAVGNSTEGIIENFHNTLPNNPCLAPGGRSGSI
ncbi:MAG TPA: hypothetical protein VHI51_04670 [Ktedonobacterales bacterium]|nr:hypothetical protein [Ktedonobacterales bacterium]